MAREIPVPGAIGRPVIRVDGNLASVRCRSVGSSDSLVAEMDDGWAGSGWCGWGSGGSPGSNPAAR
jgi:hypothetical protein